MAVIIQQLWDIELQRPVTVADVGSHSLTFVETVEVTDRDGVTHRYRLYTQPVDATPFDKETAHHKTRYNETQPPFRLYTIEDGRRVPDTAYLAHQFHTRWGDGYFRGFFIGGQPPMEYFWQRQWLQKVT